MVEFGSETEFGLTVLLGDVSGSRNLSDRAAVQRRLGELLVQMKDELGADDLAAPMELTAGDEVQAVFRCAEAAVAVIRTLADELYPVRIVYGLGYGPRSTDLAERPTLMDGPCFHRAREGLDAARRERRWVVARGFGNPWDETLGAIFRLMDAVRSRWTAKQAAYALQARRVKHRKDVAAKFGVGASVVSESLKAASFDAVIEGERAACEILAAHSRAAARLRGAGS